MRSPGRTTPLRPLEQAEHAPLSERGVRAERGLLLKHATDRAAAAVLIVLVLPVLVLLAGCLKLTARGPVLVRERRIDRQGRSFHLLGFRRLPVFAGSPVERLPELFNVLKGELSFVGPRPERPEFVELFGENLRRYDQPRRVRPGITGWEQLRGLQGDVPLAERVRWDDFYVENWSLRLDARIVLMTIWTAVANRPTVSGG
jgi:lipopolysaccharide/colanic/teichoic acid biosynthesis glycosyltransferase